MSNDADEQREIERLHDDWKRRRTWPREPKRAARVMADLLAKRGYARFRSADELAEAWTRAAGDLAGHGRPGHLRRGVLSVFLRNSATMQEVRFQEARLVARLNDVLGAGRVRGLRLKVGGID